MIHSVVRRCGVLAIVLAVGFTASAPGVSPAAGVPAIDVHGNEEQDRYEGSGGLILPGTIDHGTRVRVSGCRGCRWRMTQPCFTSSTGNPFDGQSRCLSVTRGCSNGEQLLRAWFGEAEAPWREIGLVCIGDGGPSTVADVGSAVRESFVRDLSRPAPVHQPALGVVTQIPVVFDSGQHDSSFHADYAVSGERVSLEALANWLWDFGDGATLSTADPGGRFPHAAVSHTYRMAGRKAVLMTTRWSARFTVSGLGPFAVPESVTQTARLFVVVGEGRAVLAVR